MLALLSSDHWEWNYKAFLVRDLDDMLMCQRNNTKFYSIIQYLFEAMDSKTEKFSRVIILHLGHGGSEFVKEINWFGAYLGNRIEVQCDTWKLDCIKFNWGDFVFLILVLRCKIIKSHLSRKNNIDQKKFKYIQFSSGT